ncbi:hypothetical protein pb186bvf_001272 [Paramecium bursaria]
MLLQQLPIESCINKQIITLHVKMLNSNKFQSQENFIFRIILLQQFNGKQNIISCESSFQISNPSSIKCSGTSTKIIANSQLIYRDIRNRNTSEKDQIKATKNPTKERLSRDVQSINNILAQLMKPSSVRNTGDFNISDQKSFVHQMQLLRPDINTNNNVFIDELTTIQSENDSDSSYSF